jgi:hypothetical protein
MFNELDCFRLAQPLPSEAIPVGTVGVVLMVFGGPCQEYEVEFPDGHGGNLGTTPTFTVGEEFMTPMDPS